MNQGITQDFVAFFSDIGQIWKKSIFWNFEGQNFKNGRRNQNSGFYKFFVLSKSVSKQNIEQLLQELLNSKDEKGTYF